MFIQTSSGIKNNFEKSLISLLFGRTIVWVEHACTANRTILQQRLLAAINTRYAKHTMHHSSIVRRNLQILGSMLIADAATCVASSYIRFSQQLFSIEQSIIFSVLGLFIFGYELRGEKMWCRAFTEICESRAITIRKGMIKRHSCDYSIRVFHCKQKTIHSMTVGIPQIDSRRITFNKELKFWCQCQKQL